MTTEMIGKIGYVPGTNDPYFQWLCKRADIPRRKPYVRLASELHSIIFKPGSAIETDADRANCGLRQRVQFMEMYGPQGSSTNRGACTMLEFLISLAEQMDFIMGTDENHLHLSYYFWKMIENLRLLKLSDDVYDALNGDFFVQEAVDRVLFRTYERDGSGGLFPLKRALCDQRGVEIWYQMHSWLQECDEFSAEK